MCTDALFQYCYALLVCYYYTIYFRRIKTTFYITKKTPSTFIGVKINTKAHVFCLDENPG